MTKRYYIFLVVLIAACNNPQSRSGNDQAPLVPKVEEVYCFPYKTVLDADKLECGHYFKEDLSDAVKNTIDQFSQKLSATDIELSLIHI